MIKTPLFAGLVILYIGSAYAAQTTINLDSGLSGTHVMADQNTAITNPLTTGGPGDGNGAVLQLGYFSGATTSNNFQGTWIPLSGETSLNTAIIQNSSPAESYNKTSIGDITNNGPGAGQFGFTLTFDPNDPTRNQNLPSSTTIPLSIRFYNNTSIATSTFYNVVSDDNWTWATPADPPNNPVKNISLDDSGLEWLSIALGQNANTVFHTTIPVPEPTTVAAGAMCAVSLIISALRRRRGL